VLASIAERSQDDENREHKQKPNHNIL